MSYPPPSMRTGFSNVQPVPPSISPDSPLGKKLLSLVFVLIRRAAGTAATYCEHDGRTVVTPNDIQLALKYHTHRFFKSEGLEEEAEEMESMLERDILGAGGDGDITKGVDVILDSIEEEQDDADGEGEESEEHDDEEDIEQGKTEKCTCDVCHDVRTFDWDSWCPNDPVEIFMKECVEKTLQNA